MADATTPFQSVVVPTYRRPAALHRCLEALSCSSYPKDRFEVIVVNDGGDEPLVPVIDAFRDQLDLTLLDQRNAGPAAARNTGATSACGEVLAFTDDDCRPDSDWLVRLSAAHLTSPESIVGGRVVNELVANPYAVTSQLILDIVYEQCNAVPPRATFLTANNMAVPARLFRAVGGFNASLRAAEDRDLCDRWRFRGHTLTYIPEAIVWHAHELTFRSFCRQHFTYGRGAHGFHRLRRRRGSGTLRHSLEFHSDPRKWLLQPFRRRIYRPVSITTLLVLWQLANAAGFCWEALRPR